MRASSLSPRRQCAPSALTRSSDGGYVDQLGLGDASAGAPALASTDPLGTAALGWTEPPADGDAWEHCGSGLFRSPHCRKNASISFVSSVWSGRTRSHTIAAYGHAISSNLATTGPISP